MNSTGKILIGLGVILVFAGIVVLLVGKFPGFKSMPGDMVFKRENFTLYFPLGTSILLSLLLTLAIFLWRKFGA